MKSKTPLGSITFAVALCSVPAHAAVQLAVDLFDNNFPPNYTDGSILGQGPAPGFATAWSGVAATVGGGVVTADSGTGRTSSTLFARNEYIGLVGTSGGTTVYLRTRMALGTGDGFQTLEMANATNTNIIQLVGGAGLGVFSFNGVDYSSGALFFPTANDGGFHEWLIQLDVATGLGTAWVDAITGGLAGEFNPASGEQLSFTAAPGFALDGINLGSFATASVSVDYLIIGGDLEGVLLTSVPEPSAALLGGLGTLFFLRRRRV